MLIRYRNGLRAEVHGFSESINRKVEGGHDLVNEVLREWESIVKSCKEGSWGQDDCGRAATYMVG